MADIVETAMQAGDFKTLCAALEAAGLVETLKGPGPFTVFAPNDAAFEKLPEGTVQELLNDVPRLKQTLLYHVIPGTYMADDVMDLHEVTTAQGESLAVAVSEGVMINDAKVIQTDIETDNGVIHVIDTVVMPKVSAPA